MGTCHTFDRTGKCRNGANCKYKHEAGGPRRSAGSLAMGTCHIFARMGECRNDACRYRHEGGGSGEPTPNVPHGVCRWFGTPQGCKYGSDCTFSHGSVNSTAVRPVRRPPRRLDWSVSLSLPQAMIPSALRKTITEGLAIVESEDSELRQLMIKELGSARGLQWIVKVLEGQYSINQYEERSMRNFPRRYSHERSLGFHEHCVPFLRLISHEHILASLVLENVVGTIYNVIGKRGVAFFGMAAALLQTAMDSDSTDEPQREEAIFAISATMFSTINLNQDASIQEGYMAIANSLGECLQRFPSDRQQSFALRSSARHLQRIEQRLNMGTAIPGATYATTTTASPEFQFYVDPPGDLSVNGPRHDNDHASIERICILPTTSELKAVRPEFLPMKYKESPHHETGIQRLLDSQFRLLREDTSGQLRDAVCGLVTHWDQLVRGSDKNLKRKIHRQINARLSLFTHAKVKRLNCDRRVGLTAKVTFAQPVNMSKMREQQRIAWWEESKDLQKGSIVAIVDNTLETLFLLVTERTVYQKVGVDSAHEPDEDLVGTDQNATITLALIDPTSKIDQARLMTLAAPSKDSSAVLVEFPGLLFASFEPVLKVLQSLHRQPHMPFADWLAPGPETRTEIRDGFVTVPPPLYLSRNNVFLDLTCITQDGFRLRHSLKQPVTIEELEAHTTLDRGQCQGLINSLRHELALVQGPPGTGKSYVGDKIVQILLANKHRLRIGPIICVCVSPFTPPLRLKQAVTE